MSRNSRRDRWRARREADNPPPAQSAAEPSPAPLERSEAPAEAPRTLEPPRPGPAEPQPQPQPHARVQVEPRAIEVEPRGPILRARSVSAAAPKEPPPRPRSVSAAAPQEPPPRPRSVTAACYVDFENLLFSTVASRHTLSISRVVRHLNRLGREATGVGWTHTSVYANWDAIVTHHRHAQDDWAMLGWRTVAVPAREDYLSARPIKNLVDFVMSLDILEDARDRNYEHFYLVTGDADFCEVAERLKRLRRRVTVVALKPNLSFRLREAADDFIVWGFEDITGDDPMPAISYRRLAQPAVERGANGEDPYQVLLRAVRLAERDQGVSPLPWRIVRDEYFLRMTPMPAAEADRFLRELDKAGFVVVVTRRARDGSLQPYLNIPR